MLGQPESTISMRGKVLLSVLLLFLFVLHGWIDIVQGLMYHLIGMARFISSYIVRRKLIFTVQCQGKEITRKMWKIMINSRFIFSSSTPQCFWSMIHIHIYVIFFGLTLSAAAKAFISCSTWSSLTLISSLTRYMWIIAFLVWMSFAKNF